MSMNEETQTPQPAAETQQNQSTSTQIEGRPCKVLSLPTTGYKVFMAEYLTAGEDEDASAILMEGVVVEKDSKIPYSNTVAYTHKQVEFGVKRIVGKDGQEVAFNIDWYRGLPKPDLRIIRDFILESYRDVVDEEDEDKKKQ